MGSISTIGLKITYASGKRDISKVSIGKYDIYLFKISKINVINSTIKLSKFLIYLIFHI